MTELHDESRMLLRAEQQRDELPEASIDEAWQALSARVAKVQSDIAARTPATHGDGPATSEPATATSTTIAARLAKMLPAMLLAFGAGVATDRVLLHDGAPAPSPHGSEVRSTVPEVSTTASMHASAAPIEAPNPSDPAIASAAPGPSLRPKTVAPSAPSSARGSAEGLTDERALVEGARTALLRGRPADALKLAREHEARFLDGELAEDREFLIASALRDTGHADEARARAQKFLERYPKSPLRPAVEKMAK